MWSGQPTTTTNFTHDQLNRDAAIAAASGYDAAGNLISDGSRTFTYDVENRLRSVTGGPSSVTLDYDAFGRLGTVTTGGAATHYRYAGAQLAAESSGGVLLRSHVSGQGVDEQWMSVEGTGAAATPTWYLQDRQNSVIGVSDASGAITPYAYGPYGEPQSWSGSRFRYTGQIAIPEAQLYHYRARAYDPVMGRFLQTDPIGYDDGPNVYAYVGGDPVNLSDPSGLMVGGTGGTVEEVVITGVRLPKIILDFSKFIAANMRFVPGLGLLSNVFGPDELGDGTYIGSSGEALTRLIAKSKLNTRKDAHDKLRNYDHQPDDNGNPTGGEKAARDEFKKLGIEESNRYDSGTEVGKMKDGTEVNVHLSRENGWTLHFKMRGGFETKFRFGFLSE